MCGIAGSLVLGNKSFNEEALNIQRSLLYMNMLRGVDGVGVASGSMTDPNEVLVAKKALPACDVFTKNHYRRYASGRRWILTHTRAATIGIDDPHAVHPFVEGELVGVHNGTVHGMHYKFPELEGANDSHVIYKALAETLPTETVDVLKRLDTGAYALAWYDKRINSLRFARNSDRPLWFYKHYDSWYWASEPGMIAAAIARENTNPLIFNSISPWQLRTNLLLTVPVDGTDAHYEEYTPPKVQPTSARRSYPTCSSVPTHYGRSGEGMSDEDIAKYERWWAEEVSAWGGTEHVPDQRPLNLPIEDSPRSDSYPKGEYRKHSDGTYHIVPKKSTTEEEVPGWLGLRSAQDLWNSAIWTLSYRINIFRAVRWLFDLQSGGSLGNTEEEFGTELARLAHKCGTVDGSTSVGFNAQYIDLRDNIVYGALTIDNSRVVPVHGYITNGTAKSYKKSKEICKVNGADDMPLFEGDLDSLIVYCDGTLGFELININLIGWEPKSALTATEEIHGSYITHPMRILSSTPNLTDWSNWTKWRTS